MKKIILIINVIICISLVNICIINNTKYSKLYLNSTNISSNNNIYRGRILDINGNILVDNKGIKSLIYNGTNNINNMISIADQLSDILDLNTNNISNLILKKYFYYKNEDIVNLRISSNIIQNYNRRLINEEDYFNLKLDLITKEELNLVNKKAAYIFYLMNNNYSYNDKIIKNNVTDIELNLINDLNIPGLSFKTNYIRNYNYDTSLNDLFGTIGNIPYEEKDYYLNKGYKLNDIVGISFLEKYYDDYLKEGNDLVLTIDINTQIEIDNILKEEILNAKKYESSKYYSGSYIIISNPNDGSIVALSAYNYLNNEFKSNVIGTLTNSFTLGSVVKGASQSVAYKYNVLDEKTVLYDDCVKLFANKNKCSWKRLGKLNDIKALAYSSNYFQFINAIKVAGYNYKYNMKFNPSLNDFNKYRDVFKEYGLGEKTNIDLYEEKYGITGKMISGDLLLNLSIGQYDTYTPLMLNQYISTIASNGVRHKLYLGKYIISNNKKITLNQDNILNKVNIDSKYLDRIKLGFKSVMEYGTGSSYIKSFDAAGKTGTSETYINNVKTNTKSFISFFPYDEPKYAYIIISPNISYKNKISNYTYPINSKITRKITDYLKTL